MEIRKPISVTEAVKNVMNYAYTGLKEKISFHHCDGRSLASDIIATSNVPSFNKSPYDGFALRSIDTLQASDESPVRINVIETIGAGEISTSKLGKKEAVRIMTGAEVPEGADCIIMFEKCKIIQSNKENYILINKLIQSKDNIMEIGSEVVSGQVLIEIGTLITPGVKAVLATFGYATVEVAKKPIVGVLATGTELLNVEDELEPGKIRNSNGYMICSQVNESGGIAKYYGSLPDVLDTSYQKVKHILKEVDLLITTGGVSVGDYDLIPDIYKKLNATMLFNKIAMRPGSVTTVAVKNNKLMFGLSGNPSACYVGFELYAKPVIRQALFHQKPFLKRARAQLNEEFTKANPFTRFVRGYYTFEETGIKVHLAGMDKSNVVTSLAYATCFIVLPGGTEGYQKNDYVDILIMNTPDGEFDFLN